MSEKVHLQTPAKLYNGQWVDAELILTEQTLCIGNIKIQVNQIEDIGNIDMEGVGGIRIKSNGEIIIRPPEKLMPQVFRFLAFNLKSDRFAVYYLDSATVGGVVTSGSQWEKGYFSVTDEGFWFISPQKQQKILFDNVGTVSKDVRNVGGKQRKVLVISKVEDGQVATSLLMCPETTLEMLENHLNLVIKSHKPQIEFTDMEKQILTLVYSGLDFVSIENMIGITTNELNEYYDRLVDSGLAKIVKVRKEVELTPRGVTMVGDIPNL
ncbi:CheF family chemotaxis protein [Methanococcoides burtonii]|uniref:Uncharacterized protein n=1 Tax=Methanococcoides burtonii (strain DSM 6242 / NBRC 107633 / OCM 468 / ACE-M) TaxID=259564 RepID=Q12YX3_METBU|nr:CheF family chemotaxis protein [Methanococcoides burtonii]ABE51353.1 Protein of unknown function DUF439 [Methanococcoides burtonii DSM 6242]